MENDPIGKALGAFKARILPDELRDAPKSGEQRANTVPERADELAAEIAATNDEMRASIGTGEEDNTAPTAQANATLEKAAGWIPLGTEEPGRGALDLTDQI